jgi:hypothetical protein
MRRLALGEPNYCEKTLLPFFEDTTIKGKLDGEIFRVYYSHVNDLARSIFADCQLLFQP